MEESYKKTRVAIYVRVSTDEQVLKWVSVEYQQESLTEFAKHNNYILNEKRHIYVDRWFSWASKNRPALEKLMFDSQNNEFDLVIVKKVDRFFRKNLYLLQYVEELCQNWVWFKAIDQGFNIEDSSWKMMLSMLGVIWEMERDLIRDRTISGKVQKSKMGYYVWWWYAKLWYNLENDWKWNKLSIDEEESKVVINMFNLYVNEKKSFWEICNIFNSQWIQTKFDKRFKWKETDRRKWSNHWYPWSLWKLISDEIYIWNYYYWKKWKRFDKKNWKEIEFIKPKNEWLTLESPKIIDDVTFYKAQELMKKNKTTKNNKFPHIFAWLIKCDVCWRSYIWYKTSKDTISYRCWGYSPSKVAEELRCFNKQVSEIYLIEHIWNKIDSIFKNPKELLEKYYSSNNQNGILENYRTEFNDILKKIERYSNWLKSLYKDMYLADNDMEKELKEDTVKTMEKELDQLNHRKIELNSYMVKLKRIDENKENLNNVIKIYKDTFNNISYENKVELIKEFVEKVIVYENWRLVVFFRFWNNWWWDDNWGWNNNRNWIEYWINRINRVTSSSNNSEVTVNIRDKPSKEVEVKSFNGVLCPTIWTFLTKTGQDLLLGQSFLLVLTLIVHYMLQKPLL